MRLPYCIVAFVLLDHLLCHSPLQVAAQEKERFEKELAVKDSELEELRKKVRVLEGASYANTTVASEGAET